MNDADILETPVRSRRNRPTRAAAEPQSLVGCLKLLSLAFDDLAERDDIHQAAGRLRRVLRWIGAEAARAADNPVFADDRGCVRRERKLQAASKDGRQIWRDF